MYGWLAKGYAWVDTKIALGLFKDADKYAPLEVSRIIARRDPDLTEKLLGHIDFREKPDLKRRARFSLAEICYRLALTDGDRAERVMSKILEETQPAADDTNDSADVEDALLRAQLLGVLAESAVRSDKVRAKRLLEQAIATLQPLSVGYFHKNLGWYFTPATLLGTLIPAAEQSDPAFAREMFWRALALRMPPFKGEGAEQHSHDLSLAFLALMLDRYDHDIADAIFSPVWERETSRFLNGAFVFDWVYKVQRRIDPESANKFARELLAAPETSREPSSAAARRLFIAGLLAGPRDTTSDDDLAQHEDNRRVVRQTLQYFLRMDDE
jgi:hypothetical protein